MSVLRSRSDPLEAARGSYAEDSRASSPEMIATSSDSTADDRYRKTAHKTRSERRRSLGGDEMATHGGRARALRRRDPLHARASCASSPDINETSSDVTADGRYRKIAHETRSERRRSPGGDDMATHGDRTRPLRRRDPPRESQSRELIRD